MVFMSNVFMYLRPSRRVHEHINTRTQEHDQNVEIFHQTG